MLISLNIQEHWYLKSFKKSVNLFMRKGNSNISSQTWICIICSLSLHCVNFSRDTCYIRINYAPCNWNTDSQTICVCIQSVLGVHKENTFNWNISLKILSTILYKWMKDWFGTFLINYPKKLALASFTSFVLLLQKN